MNINRSLLYCDAADYFRLDGSAVMRLTRHSAIHVCEQAFDKGLLITMIEGGNWQHPGFMSRLDSIWSWKYPPVTREIAKINNKAAVEFIISNCKERDVFILTTKSFQVSRGRDI